MITISLLAGIALMFVSFFIKSPLIKIAVALCMLQLTFCGEVPFVNSWLQTAAALIAIWAILAAFFRFEDNIGA